MDECTVKTVAPIRLALGSMTMQQIEQFTIQVLRRGVAGAQIPFIRQELTP